MAFPLNPSIGDLFTTGSKSYRWDGNVWSRSTDGLLTTANITESGGNFFYSNARVKNYLGNVDGPLVPASDEGFNLGTSQKKWANLFLSGNTIVLGQTKIESSSDGSIAIKSTNAQVTTAISFSSNGYIAAPSGPLSTASGAVSATPKISNVQVTDVSYALLDDTAANSGGYVTINGSNFDSGATVVIGTTSANSVSFVNSTKLNVALPPLTAGTYTVYVTNSDGGTALRINGLSISGTPTWTTASGSIATAYESFPLTTTVNAVSDTAVVYSLLSGSLPDNANLNPGNGNIFVTSTALTNSNTTFNFTLNATDTELQNTSRAFSATVLTDGVRWATSNVDEIIIAPNNTSFSYTLNAVSLSSRALQYAANGLPNGLSLSGNVISGTFSAISNVNTVATANTSNTNKSNFYNLCFVVYQGEITVQYMVVAGGGGGGYDSAGGGGAGGFRQGNLTVLSGSTHAVVLGGGGAGGGAPNGANGSPSCFSSIVSAGGGGGGGQGQRGWPGGSGGGAGTSNGQLGGAGNQPSVSPSQGNCGGCAGSGPWGFVGGGGGGGSGIGSNGVQGQAGPGGAGCTTCITGTNTTFAGGGGGGSWSESNPVRGAGGAGGGAAGNAGSAGPNCGGGGGGGGIQYGGGNGGSGIIILRIPSAYTASFSSVTATPASGAVAGFKIYCVTAGSGTVSFN